MARSFALFFVLVLRAAHAPDALTAERRNVSFVHCPALLAELSAPTPCPEAVPGAVELVTPALVSRATLSFGQPWVLSSVAARLRAGKCVTVAALGGSVTLGHSFANRKADEPGAWRDTDNNFHHPDAPRSHVAGDESEATAWAEAYPRYLKDELDAAWPCHLEGGHTIHNLGRGATPSPAFVSAISENKDANFMVALHSAHLVVVEFGLNDVGLGNASLPAIETLVIQLLNFPQRPAVMLLGTSSLNVWASRDEPWMTFNGCLLPGNPLEPDPCNANIANYRSLIHEHAEVGHHYGLPVVSAVDALGPFDTPKLQDWWHTVWKVDPLHISHTAHQLVAALIAGHLSHQLTMWAHPAFGLEPNLAWGPLPPPRFVDTATLSLELGKSPLVLSPRSDAVVVDGFSEYEDRPGKRGWIATTVGARSVYALPAAELAGRSRVIHASLMHSYQHNGVARLRVYAPLGTASCAEGSGSVAELGTTTADTLWTLHASEAEVAVLQFAAPPAAAAVCLELIVLSADPARAENKVKLLDLAVY